MTAMVIVALNFTMANAKEPKPSLSGSFNSLGATLHLECYGSKAPTVVVNSGFGGAGSQGGWEAVIKHISSSNRICLYDRANTGKSGRFDKHNDVGVMARQLDALLSKVQLAPPYIMLSHSYGSYPVRMYHHYYRDKVAAVMLVDPTQYGMFANAIAKWRPDIDSYTDEIEQRRVAELSAWNDPTSNGEGIDNKASAALIQQADTFGDTPLVLIWSRDGIWQGGEAPDDWHPQVWQRMKVMYRQAVDDMHQLSTAQKTLFATTPQHNIFAYEPEIINQEFDLLLQAID